MECRNPEGRKRSRSFKKFNEAREYLRRIEYEVQTDTYVDSADGKITLAEYYAEFKTRQLWDGSTYENTDQAVAPCSFAGVQLNKIRRTHVGKWVKEMTGSLAPGTVHMRFRRVRSIIKGAIRDRHLGRDPLEDITLPRLSNEEMHIPTPETVGKILNAAEPHYKTMWAVCAFAKLGRGEAAGLKVSDVRFLKRELRVDRQVQALRANALQTKEPKHGSNRTIYIPDDLVQMLSEHVTNGVNGEWLFMGRGEGQAPHPNIPKC